MIQSHYYNEQTCDYLKRVRGIPIFGEGGGIVAWQKVKHPDEWRAVFENGRLVRHIPPIVRLNPLALERT